MFKKLLVVFIFGGILVSQSACKLTNDEDAVVDVDPIFVLDMVEDLQNNRELSFWVRSIELQDCVNFTIGQSLEKTTSNLNVSLNNIIEPLDCIVGEAPAIAEIPLGFLSVGRIFNTSFAIKNTINNHGKLTINSDAYLLELESKDGFGNVAERLNKISDNLIWGYVAFDEESVVGNLPTDFLADLAELTNDKVLIEGYYGHFSIDDEAALSLRQTPDFQRVITFYYNHFNDSQLIKGLVESYQNGSNTEEIAFKVFTADGEVF